MKIRTIIVDDELKSRSTLRKILADYCEKVEVIGEAADIAEAAAHIEKLKPTLVFLDIVMPEGPVFNLLDKLPNINFEIIFVTAYNKYAIDAFEYNSIDYLLKPVNIDKLQKAVDRVAQRIDEKTAIVNYRLLLEQARKKDPGEEKVQLTSANEQLIVKYNDIIYCIADGSYTFVQIAGGKRFHVSRNLKQLTATFPASIFFRIHNGHLINMNHVSRVIKGQSASVVMSDGKEFEIAVRRKDEFLKALR
ncbi:MAG: LytTR family DNA-binding domain-containing protein [Ferruginibacter sp.]